MFSDSFNIVTHVYVPLGIWLLAIIALLVFLIFKYPFGRKWTKDNPNPFESETLAIPRGTFRGILTLTLVFGAVLFEISNLATGNDESNIYEFMTAFKMMIAFYFGSKVAHHVSAVEKHKTKIKADAMIKTNESGYTESEEEFEITESEDAVG